VKTFRDKVIVEPFPYLTVCRFWR